MSHARAPSTDRGRQTRLLRLSRLAEVKERQARQVRNADNTARGERAAGEADLDAAALRWAVRELETNRLS